SSHRPARCWRFRRVGLGEGRNDCVDETRVAAEGWRNAPLPSARLLDALGSGVNNRPECRVYRPMELLQVTPTSRSIAVMPALQISEAVRRIQPSATIAAAQKAKALKATGVTVYEFTLGEPDFTTP